jgi:site-specific DNA-methyltransferase (cytosine-N4-specific)
MIAQMAIAQGPNPPRGVTRPQTSKLVKRAERSLALHEDALQYGINGSAQTVTRLSRVSWDFANASATRRSIHAFHSYPARFIPEIPRAIIHELNPRKGTYVFDPFCGCGTTLVEAQQSGFASVGVDLNPIGCLISRVKTTPLPSGFSGAATRCIAEARQREQLPPPQIPNLMHWFRVDVCAALAALRLAIRYVEDPATRQALEAVFSSIIVRVSNQDSDTRYAAVKKSVSRETVFDAFAESAQTLASLALTLPLLAQAPATVINSNVFEVQPAEIPRDVGLVVTSPPYPNAYEYWLYHKYRMWWLGFDPLAVKSMEIGARAHFFSGRKHKKEDFYEQMSGVFKLLVEVMHEGAYCCFIVGDSKIYGQIVDNADLLMKAAARHGFKLVFKSDREINPHRKSFNLHHARIKREHILVWER